MSVNKVDKTTGNTSLLAGSTLWADSPIGSILPYGGASAPSGWFLCNGSAISRTTYAELFAVIGTVFGSGDGSTTFNLPDMRESVPKGAGLTGKSNNHYDSDGLALGEFIDDRLQDHTHQLTLSPNVSFLTGEGNYKTVPVSQGSTQTGVIPSTYRNGATTEVKSVGVNYIIKAKMVGVPADFMSAVDEAVSGKADRATKVTAADLGFEVNSTQSVKNTLNALGDYNVIQFRWGSATSFNISDGTNSISSSGGSILRASGEALKKEGIFIDPDKKVYLIGFKNNSEYIKKLAAESDFNYQSGISTSIDIDPHTINQFSITFDTPMSDTDYVAIVNTNGVNGGLFASVWNKITTGFNVTIYNANTNGILNQSFEWKAFKIPH